MSEDDTMTVGTRLDALLSASQVSARLSEPDVVILDATVVRSDGTASAEASVAQWELAHIPGSRHADLVAELSDPESKFGFTRPSPERIAAGFGELGVGPDTSVIIYDADDRSMWATRVWWLGHSIGLPNLYLLDGGWRAWTRAGLPVEQGAQVAPQRQAPLVAPLRNPVEAFIDTADVLAGRATGGPLLCALDPDVFSGEAGDYARRGHIPGAVNVPARSLLRPDGTFHDPDTLADLLVAYRGADPVDIYCGGGISATVVAFVLTNLGWPTVRVYDGSLEEWAADSSLPLETGS